MSDKAQRLTRRIPERVNSQDQKLLQELHAAWGFAVDAPLSVIGQLTRFDRDQGSPVTFLFQLEHPVSGLRLVYPQHGDSESARVFVPPSELAHLKDPEMSPWKNSWALAELELSSVWQREKQQNPHACTVRPGTLRLLSDVPEHWNVPVDGTELARRVTAAARKAIDKLVEDERSRSGEAIARLREEIARNALRKLSEEAKLEGVRDAIRLEQLHLQNLNTRATREARQMEERFRRLGELLAVRGDRLVALGLIDAGDRDALLSRGATADTRRGHDFQEAFGGDFARLATFLQARLWKRGMLYSKAQLRDFLALLRTHDLIVLAGDSGSGKTSLIRAVADSIGGRCVVIPVKPNWTGPEDLLGYYNPIERSYLPTPFLQALQAAEEEPEVPHLICLDEMNIARVEHYFADFLSLLEERGGSPEIQLYTSDEERHAVVESGLFLAIEAEVRARSGLPEGTTFADLLRNDGANALLRQLGGFQDSDPVLVHHARLRRALAALVRTPTSLVFPSNVRIIGAVNVDETTHYLSPKVLDRAHVLRFRNPVLVDWDALEVEVEDPGLDLDVPVRLAAWDFGPREEYPLFDRTDGDTAWLAGLARGYLDPLGVEFGFRAIRQSANYLRHAKVAGIGGRAALNNVVLHKVLPKLTLDMGRTGDGGRSKRDLLLGLRDTVRERMTGLDSAEVTELCTDALNRLIKAADDNDGVANYWLR